MAGNKSILVRISPEAWKALNEIALDHTRALQVVIAEAINDDLQKQGKPPLA